MDNGKPYTVDEYISMFQPEIQAVLEKVRTTIKQSAPNASEAMSYAIPTFKLNGKIRVLDRAGVQLEAHLLGAAAGAPREHLSGLHGAGPLWVGVEVGDQRQDVGGRRVDERAGLGAVSHLRSLSSCCEPAAGRRSRTDRRLPAGRPVRAGGRAGSARARAPGPARRCTGR